MTASNDGRAMTGERSALVLSALAALVLGVAGVTVSVVTGSAAILLDGLFNLCFFATALLTLRVATLVARPDDERYPFGYIFFEPLINTAKGLLILGVSLFAAVDAGLALARGGGDVVLGPAVAYAAGATLLCAATALALGRALARHPSPLVAADVDNWKVNGVVSAGVLAGFLLAAFLLRRGEAGAARLVDPAMVVLVVLLSVAVPIRMAVAGLAALLNRSLPRAVVADIEALVRGALAGQPVARLWVRAIRPGRTAYVVVHVLVDSETAPGAAPDLATADRLRGAIIAALAARHGPVVVDVVFTGVEAYAAPSAGFTA